MTQPTTEPTLGDLAARLDMVDQRIALAVDTIRLVAVRLEPISQTLDELVHLATTQAKTLGTLVETTSARFDSLAEATATIIDTLAAHIRDHGQER